jgi:hypothetical protein
MANSKRVAALGMKILNILKDMGMSPRFGMMTKVSRNPEFRNLYNADLTSPEILRKGLGNIKDPEQLKKLVRMDSDFLPQIKNEEELETFLNNLQFLRSTYPNIFSKAEVVTEAKTGLKTLVDDVNEKLQGKKSMETFDPNTGEVTIPKAPVKIASKSITEVIDEGIKKQADMARKGFDPGNPDDYVKYDESIKKNKSRQLTKEEIQDYEELLGDSETWMSEGTVGEAEKALKRSKAEEAYYRTQYKLGKLDPVAGEKNQSRLNFLRKKAEYAEDVKDRRLFTLEEMNELDELEKIFEPRSSSSINISDPKTAEDFTNFIKQNDPEGFKKIQKITDDINNKNILEDFDVKDREPNAKGGSVGNLTYNKMFSDLDRTLDKGLGTMFKKRKR